MVIDASLVAVAISTLTLAGTGIGAYVSVIQRLTRVEAVISLFGEKAAKMLHSPDNHHGIDDLLDKYLDRNYELSFDEWTELKTKCEAIEANKSLSHGERILAAFLSALAHHKLLLPPPIRKHSGQ